jgi:8-oxo-dGTP pyrophosphatase MutT (NUDIX family)
VEAFDAAVRSSDRLIPENAVAAIIVVEDSRYLLQHRDDKPLIFFPGHWGCFGGAIEPGETDETALVRELDEELSLDLGRATVSYFTNFDFDFGYAGYGVLRRRYFEIRIDSMTADGLRLSEGQAKCEVPTDKVLTMQRLVPYDAYALWMHCSRAQLEKR